MPDLTFHRGAEPPVKMVCMYCGAPATHVRERRVKNPRLDPPAGSGSGGSSFEIPRGDDPISGCIVLVLLPFVLYGLFTSLRAHWRHRVASWRSPPLVPPHTLVTITTCDRHCRYARRFGRAALVVVAVLVVLWVGVILLRHQPGGAPLWLVMSALVGTFASPAIFALVYDADGPVRVSRVARDTVTVRDVRRAYFDAPG